MVLTSDLQICSVPNIDSLLTVGHLSPRAGLVTFGSRRATLAYIAIFSRLNVLIEHQKRRNNVASDEMKSRVPKSIVGNVDTIAKSAEI